MRRRKHNRLGLKGCNTLCNLFASINCLLNFPLLSLPNLMDYDRGMRHYVCAEYHDDLIFTVVRKYTKSLFILNPYKISNAARVRRIALWFSALRAHGGTGTPCRGSRLCRSSYRFSLFFQQFQAPGYKGIKVFAF